MEYLEPAYLDDCEVVQLIQSVDDTNGPRDRALLLLLYNTGARVQEIVDLDIGDIHDDGLPFVQLLGKGRKQRTCPLWPRTIAALRAWLESRGQPNPDEPLFLSARGRRLSRSGIAYMLRRAANRAKLEPRHARDVTPHVVRHTTAMHLLQSGVDITTIAAWLGHAQLSTTHAYVEINLRMKQEALAGLAAPPDLDHGEYPSDEIINWLENIGKKPGYVQQKPKAPSHVAGPRSNST